MVDINIKLARLISGLIDYYICVFISTIMVAIFTLGKMEVSLISVIVFLVSFFFSICFKDMIFENASIGKKLLKIKISKGDKTKISFIDSTKRTLPLILLPLELFMILSDNKRLGDIWANTSIIES